MSGSSVVSSAQNGSVEDSHCLRDLWGHPNIAKKRRPVYLRKAEIASQEKRFHTLDRWQRRDERTLWTAVLIRHVRPWNERYHGEVGFYLTRFLSGHEYFPSYLYKVGKAPDYLYCAGS